MSLWKRHITMVTLLSALLLAACSDDTPTPADTQTPLTLGVSVEQPATRAGGVGCIDYSVLARSSYGFGVFAYGSREWNNQQVLYKDSETDPVDNLRDVHLHPGNWSYGTEVDWLNTDDISFLAYAPYVDSPTGSPDWGITAIKATDADNTTLDYTVGQTLDKSVDLLWGINGPDGKPWLNTTLEKTGGPVTFTFRHALAAIGFHVQAMIDQENNLENLEDESDVSILGELAKISVESLTLTGPFYTRGTLNLNNTDKNLPRWTAKLPDSPASDNLTLSVANSDIPDAIRYHDDLTPQVLVESTPAVTGVTQEAQQLLLKPLAATGAEQCFFAIPNAAQDYKATIVWYVTGKISDDKYLKKRHESTIDIKGLPLNSDTKYYLNFVIGLNTIRLSVTAEDWQENEVPVNVVIEHGTSASQSLARALK